MTDTAREFDVVLFGATGAAGRVTARHLAATAPPHLRIALAGRSLTRLQSLTEGLGEAAGGWPMVALDATDEDAVRDLAGRTRVVATTVGPYVTYGAALLAACAEAGTDYCDITGEVLFAAEAARADGARLGRTRLAVRSLRGSLGGGTVDTVRTQVDEVTRDTRARRIMRDPWALAEGGRPPRAQEPTASGDGHTASGRSGLRGLVAGLVKASPVKRDVDNGHFTGPFVMAAFNTRIVARSASLLGYGPDFRYVEYTDFGSGPAGMLGQAALALAEDGDRLPDATGVLTPATAIGMPLVERLREHRFTFETERLPD